MGYGNYVGRVGALAVALGIGAAVATATPGVAWAGPDTTNDGAAVEKADTPDESNDSTKPLKPGDTLKKDIDRAADNFRRAISSVVTSSGGAIQSELRRAATDAVKGPRATISSPSRTKPRVKDFLSNFTDGESASPTLSGGPVTALESPNTRSAQPVNVPPRWQARLKAAEDIAVQRPTVTVLDKVKSVTEDGGATTPKIAERNSISAVDATSADEAEPAPRIARAPLGVITSVLSAALAPFFGANSPGQPEPQNPVLWAVLGWVRRQVQDTPFGHAVLNQAPVITTPAVVDNGDGTFTITPSGTDPDGDALTYTATSTAEGTVTPGSGGTLIYTVTNPDEWDKSDTITLTASDEAAGPHVHGLFGFLSPGGGHTSSIEVAIAPDDGSLPPPPEVVTPPTRNEETGNYDTVLQYNPATVANVSAAPGFEPKYWKVVSETYDPVTGKYTAVLAPTQAGQLRAALGLDTTDDLKLQVTNQPTTQTLGLRSASFAALEADPPDQALTLPTPPAANFVIKDEAIPAGSKPAGVYVTDEYAYVVNSQLGSSGGGGSTVTVIDADPDSATYNQVIDTIPVGNGSLFASQSDDRLYVLSLNSGSVTVIDTGNHTRVDADPNDGEDDVDAISVPSGSFNLVGSPDGKHLYVFNQGDGNVYVVDTDSTTDTYKLVDLNSTEDGVQGIPVGAPGTSDPDTGTSTSKSVISGGFSSDGSRLYVVRNTFSITPNPAGSPSPYTVSGNGEVVTIDTATNTVVGDPVDLGQYGGYSSSDGRYLYVPSFKSEDLQALVTPGASPPQGYVTVVDIQNETAFVVDVDPATPEVDRLTAGKLPLNVVFSPDGSLAYVVNSGDGTITVIDTAANEVIDLDTSTQAIDGIVYDATPAGSQQDASLIGISPNGNQIYITSFNENRVIALSFVPATPPSIVV